MTSRYLGRALRAGALVLLAPAAGCGSGGDEALVALNQASAAQQAAVDQRRVCDATLNVLTREQEGLELRASLEDDLRHDEATAKAALDELLAAAHRDDDAVATARRNVEHVAARLAAARAAARELRAKGDEVQRKREECLQAQRASESAQADYRAASSCLHQ